MQDDRKVLTVRAKLDIRDFMIGLFCDVRTNVVESPSFNVRTKKDNREVVKNRNSWPHFLLGWNIKHDRFRVLTGIMNRDRLLVSLERERLFSASVGHLCTQLFIPYHWPMGVRQQVDIQCVGPVSSYFLRWRIRLRWNKLGITGTQGKVQRSGLGTVLELWIHLRGATEIIDGKLDVLVNRIPQEPQSKQEVRFPAAVRPNYEAQRGKRNGDARMPKTPEARDIEALDHGSMVLQLHMLAYFCSFRTFA